MSNIVRAEEASDCPCCTGELRSVWGSDKVCYTCFSAGLHLCGESTKAGTPCKRWSRTPACAQHTAPELTLIANDPTDEVQKPQEEALA